MQDHLVVKIHDALISGRYKQIKGALHGGGDRFCFAGVALQTLAVSERIKMSWIGSGAVYSTRSVGPIEEAFAQAGLTNATLNRYIHLNDNGASFAELARLLRLEFGERFIARDEEEAYAIQATLDRIITPAAFVASLTESELIVPTEWLEEKTEDSRELTPA